MIRPTLRASRLIQILQPKITPLPLQGTDNVVPLGMDGTDLMEIGVGVQEPNKEKQRQIVSGRLCLWVPLKKSAALFAKSRN